MSQYFPGLSAGSPQVRFRPGCPLQVLRPLRPAARPSGLSAAIPQPFACRLAMGLLACLLLLGGSASAQLLKPGFDRSEYLEVLKVTARQLDTPWKANMAIPAPAHYRLAHRAATTGLDNRWDLWLRDDDRVALISVRGTTLKNISWLENFYSAMIPASGAIRLSDSFRFSYQLCDDPRAAVHIGWMIGLASISQDLVAQIRLQYAAGIRDFILAGHSQGGAIDYLLTAYLYDLRRQGQLPADLHFKTYCSAAPKPGNLYFAYAYEQLTADGWAVNVVNPADWVPQTPVSVQTSNDAAHVNPFRGARRQIRRMKFPQNLVIGYLYGRLDGSTKKAQRRYERYLGRALGRQIRKLLPGYVQPALAPTADYVRTGDHLILRPDAAYYSRFPDSSSNVFIHHMIQPYLYLTGRYPELPAGR